MAFGLENYIENEYLRAVVVLAIIFIVLKLFVFITEKIIIRVSKKTKTDIDDKIVERTSKPISFIILVLGLRIALDEISLLSGNTEIIIHNIIYSVIIILIGFTIYRVIDLFISRAWKKFSQKTKSELDENLYSLVRGILHFVWIVFVLLYILSLWGVEIGPFLAGLGIAGIAIALALQPTLANIFSGLSIVLDKTVRVGDLVYIDEKTKGKILEVGLRSTKIITFDNELIIVPNSKLADSIIQNVALPEPKTRVVIQFGVSYGTNIDKVKKLILNEIVKVKHFDKDPSPVVRFAEMGDSALIFKIYFYVDSFENKFEAIDDANTRIYNILNKNKISIPFPQMEVHVKKN